MSDFLSQLKRFEDTVQAQRKTIEDIRVQNTTHTADDRKTLQSLRGKIVLDPRLDPDPYSLHGMSLSYRLESMGWK